MIKRLHRLMGTIFVFAFLLSVCASIGIAQSNVNSSATLERERLNRIMDAGTNIEEFREEYLNYLTDLEYDIRLFNAVPAVQQKLNRSGLKPSAMLVAAKTSVSKMSTEDLTKVRSVYAKFPGWRETPQALIRPDIRQELEVRLNAKKAGAVTMDAATIGVTMNAVTTDNCADGISAGITNTDISISKALEIAANIVMESLPTDALTFEGHAAASVALGLIQTATLSLETLKGIKDDCRDDAFQDAVPGLITVSTTTTAGNITTSTATTATNITNAKDAIIANDNTNKTTIVNNDNANTLTILTAVEAAKTYIVTDAHANKDEVKNLLLRTQIEADLSSTDGSTFVALYETPTSVCRTSLNDKGLPQSVSLPGFPTITIPQCGLLDLVRAIVRDTIANVGAGTNAQSFFASAEVQKNAGKYKAAYALYRQAYKAASK